MLLDADVIAERRSVETERARGQMRTKARLAIFATAALLIVSGMVVPFLSGHPLHAYWDTFGKYLLMFGMGLVLVWGSLVRSAVNAWALVCKLENEVQ